jgi:hypothetical protein
VEGSADERGETEARQSGEPLKGSSFRWVALAHGVEEADQADRLIYLLFCELGEDG